MRKYNVKFGYGRKEKVGTVCGILLLALAAVFFVGGIGAGVCGFFYMFFLAIQDFIQMCNGETPATAGNIFWMFFMFLVREIVAAFSIGVSWLMGMVCVAGAAKCG